MNIYVTSLHEEDLRKRLTHCLSSMAYFDSIDIVKANKYAYEAQALQSVLSWFDYQDSWKCYRMFSKVVRHAYIQV